MSEHQGSCHCGRIRLTFLETPPDAAECKCSICRRTAGLWHHCTPNKATVESDRVAYRQGDCMLDTWHCGTCACMTHWTPVDPDYPRMAVNLRMFE